MKPITLTLPFDSYVTVTLALRIYINTRYDPVLQDEARNILADIEKQAEENYFKPNV